MKTIIVVQGRANLGKSSAIVATYYALANGFPPRAHIDNPNPDVNAKPVDIYEELLCYGKRVGINSEGDPNSDLLGRLKEHAKHECDVILTASRTRDSTVHDIEKIAKKFEYEIIWTSHYYTDSEEASVRKSANWLFAQSMVDTIHRLCSVSLCE